MQVLLKIVFVLLQVIAICYHCPAQSNRFNFHHVPTSKGLCDGVVRSITQDKYGYIWIATLSGLNRYNGYTVKRYQNIPRDNTSFPQGLVRSILADSQGNLWFSNNTGLYRFDYSNSQFHQVKTTERFIITKMIEVGKDNIYLATDRGLARFTPTTGQILFYQDDRDSLNRPLLLYSEYDIFLSKQTLYIATGAGLVLFDIGKQRSRLVSLSPVSNNSISRVAVDDRGNVWVSYGIVGELLLKTDTSFSKFRVFRNLYFSETIVDNTISNLFIDSRQRLWVTTSLQGLVLYDEKNDKFTSYTHDPLQPSSPGANQYVMLFQDKQGYIWIGSEGYGVDYFHPDKNFLQVIAPMTKDNLSLPFWARTATEDKDGNLWLGWGGALTRQNEKDSSFKIWRNLKDKPQQVHYNSIRSLLCDDNTGDLYIGTGYGMNCFRRATKKMEFLNEKDSLPISFYWCIFQDSHKTIWFGNRSDFYYLNPFEKKIQTSASHPVLSRFKNQGVHCIIEDSKGRLWFGLNGSGLIMYDPQKQFAKQWKRDESNDTTLLGNIITSLAEDKKGIIWISSFFGLVSYDPQKDQFKQYTNQNGLSSVKTSCLAVDEKNRLWIGGTAGLLMLDSTRQHFKTFDKEDGLPTMEFNDQTAYKMRNGKFIFPSLKGFVVFDPREYEDDVRSPELYLAGIKVHNQDFVSNINYENLQRLDLRHDENFFSIELAALNYANPEQTWYAYKLEPFDKEWIYTKERTVNYTNVPGGEYIFYYKASADPNNWKVPGKILTISVGTVFYKTTSFWIISALLIGSLLYWLYTKRMQHKESIYLLKSKAQALEKEKALVQYESLKQQLNPHFLFNSLTSLNSLIRSDQKQASSFLDSMSKIYRYILKSRDNELVTLIEEINFVETYIKLQKTRFDKGFEVNIRVDEKYYQKRIAPVTLQNLIENAIKHNILDEDHPLIIEMYTEGDYLVVRNNLQKKNFVETSNKQGLAHLQSLYHYLTKRSVEIKKDDHYFIIKIPLIN